MNARRRRTDGARILVVEDHEDFRLLMELTLQDAGYVVDTAASSEDALRMLGTSRNQTPYALVLTDYSLPGHSGAWLLAQAAATYGSRGLPAMIVTGDPDAPGIPGDVAVVRKPVNVDLLLSQVRAIIGNSPSMSRLKAAGHSKERLTRDVHPADDVDASQDADY
jgi:CheY-like chemotaxis protein